MQYTAIFWLSVQVYFYTYDSIYVSKNESIIEIQDKINWRLIISNINYLK